MATQASDIKNKFQEIYPEIEQYGVGLQIEYNSEKKAWEATFEKNGNKLSTHLEDTDVHNCLLGKKCYNFGIQLGQFIRNYCEGGEACKL